MATVATIRSTASNTATPTMPAGAVSGDLIVVFAYRNAATAPSLPTNWTNIILDNSNPSLRVAYRVYDGVWTMPAFTNAGRTHSVAVTTGTYNTSTPAGNSVTVGAVANETITWAAFATNVDDDTSLVFRGVVKGRVNSLPTPTAHTLLHLDGTQPAFATFTSDDRSEPAAATSATGRNDAHTVVQVEILGKPGLSATLGQNTETDTSQAMGRAKRKTLGQNTETDLAQAVGKAKHKTIGLNSETDTALPITARKSKTLGQATETNLAQPLVTDQFVAVGQATETDLSQAVTSRKAKAIGQPAETDLAQPVGRAKSRTLGIATETDLAQPVTKAKRKAIGQTVETDLAQTVVRGVAFVVPIGLVTETDQALPVTALKRKAVAQATETDTALTITRRKSRTTGLNTETDTLFSVTKRKRKGVGQVTETDTVFSVRLPLYHFSPPSYEKVFSPPPLARGPRFKLDQAISIIRVGGVLRQARSPHPSELVGTEGVDWFLGGRMYQVTNGTKNELIAAGFSVGGPV